MDSAVLRCCSCCPLTAHKSTAPSLTGCWLDVTHAFMPRIMRVCSEAGMHPIIARRLAYSKQLSLSLLAHRVIQHNLAPSSSACTLFARSFSCGYPSHAIALLFFVYQQHGLGIPLRTLYAVLACPITSICQVYVHAWP